MWYCASILSVALKDGERGGNSLWEEQFVLIEAPDEESARTRAQSLAQQPRSPYKNVAGQSVLWQFVKVERVCEILDDSLRHGTEIFSRFLRESEAKSLMAPFNDEEL